MGGGFQRIAKALGGITINGERFVWDYVADKAVPEAEMPFGSARHAASERARAEVLKAALSSAAGDDAPKEKP